MRALRDQHVQSGLLLAALIVSSCGGKPADLAKALQVTEVTTGWYDVGVVEGNKNKLVPTVSFRLKNQHDARVSSVQINAVFRRVGEQDEWGSAFVRGIGSDGLKPGQASTPIVLRSQLGYTGEQPRGDILQHSQFRDATVQLFAKQGSADWVKIGEFQVARQLLTR